jgi:murein DD-endopeptidase MepM/ murein hydrolase activator NlpD
MGDRRLTLILVPHGDLETRTYQISYRRLKLLLGGAVGVAVAFVVIATSWVYVAAQAGKASGLEEELKLLRQDREKVAELARTLAEVEAQYERVRKLLGAEAGALGGRESVLPPLRPEGGTESRGDDTASAPSAWPLSVTGFVTREATGNREGEHPGLDIAVPQDSYIRAAGAGTVRAAGTDSIYGRYVLIEHAGGYQTMYGHASQLYVAAGDAVERHEVIALSGSTGRSTAPHLHFELRRNGTAIDPLPWIQKR